MQSLMLLAATLSASGFVAVPLRPPLDPTARLVRPTTIVMKHRKNKPKRRTDPRHSAVLPSSSHSKTSNTWRQTTVSNSSRHEPPQLLSQPTLQVDHLPAPRDGERVPTGRYPALVLNADYTPLSHVPLSLWSWQDTVRAVFRGAVTVLSTYDVTVRSPSVEFELPSVIVLNKYAQVRGKGKPCHAAQPLPARPLRVPVLPHAVPDWRPDVRPRRTTRQGRAHHLGERCYRLQQVQPPQGLAPLCDCSDLKLARCRASRRGGAAGKRASLPAARHARGLEGLHQLRRHWHLRRAGTPRPPTGARRAGVGYRRGVSHPPACSVV